MECIYYQIGPIYYKDGMRILIQGKMTDDAFKNHVEM